MTKIKINLDVPFINLDGSQFYDEPAGMKQTLGRVLGNQLVASNRSDAVKYYDWAIALYNGQAIEVDKSDFNKIKDFVDKHEGMIVLAKAQILQALDESEKASK